MLDTALADPGVGEEISTRTAYQRYRLEVSHIGMLSDEETYVLGRRVWDNQDPEAKERLIKSHLRLVAWVARKFLWKKALFEDLLQAGNVGLIKAAGKYNPDKAKFSTFAPQWIEWAIKEMVCEKPHTTLLEDEPVRRHIPTARTEGLDFLIAKEEYLDQIRSVVALFRAVDTTFCLSDRDKMLFNLRYDFENYEYGRGGDSDKGELLTLDELAHRAGISRQGVSKRLAVIWAKAKDHGLISSWGELREKLACVERLKTIVHGGG